MSVARNPIVMTTNVVAMWQSLKQAMDRPEQLPGIVAVYGASGLGKSLAAAWCATKSRAYYVELRSTWTKKALIEALAREIGLPRPRTIYEGVDAVAEQLALSNRPLIIDEADYLTSRNNVEVVRDLYEASHGTILIIGEETLPTQLARWERFHNRVLEWVPATACTLEDARQLAEQTGVKMAAEVLAMLLERTHGVTRRVAVNLETMRRTAQAEGWDEVTLARWAQRAVYTGAAPLPVARRGGVAR